MDSILEAACQIAKHRNHGSVERKDVQLAYGLSTLIEGGNELTVDRVDPTPDIAWIRVRPHSSRPSAPSEASSRPGASAPGQAQTDQ